MASSDPSQHWKKLLPSNAHPACRNSQENLSLSDTLSHAFVHVKGFSLVYAIPGTNIRLHVRCPVELRCQDDSGHELV